ncbi:glutamine synthetase family protein [Halococcus agarilyticus]|uniref:glutamine synthetase family protein n=1 Tax=Halococcus agarilyticus TaxID=1232219 RepID=UPI000677B868|nr:glutamine synthetase family protein [Halococcus agarilyticus]
MTAPTTAAEMEERIETAGIEHVLTEFADLNGISRSKQFAAEQFLETWSEGPSMNLAVLGQTPGNEMPVGSGLAAAVDYADATLRPDPTTFRVLPWRENTARVLCDLAFDGEPVAAAPRDALRRVLDDHEFGFEFGVGSELEFYLLEDTDAGYEPVTDGPHEYVSWATEEITPFYERLAAWAREYGIPLDSLQHEHGPGQFEILFEHGAPLDQADRTFDFERVVERTARAADRYATFMAKPFADHSGSGYHLHVSAFDGGENVFADGDGGLSERGRQFVGGLLEHAAGLTAIGTPTMNGFKRYDPEGFVPTTASWGRDNRRVAVRLPNGTPRVETRIGSADANPYLVIAATLVAGLHGLRDEIDPGEAVEGNPSGRRPRLPRTQGEALAALEADDELVDALGAELVRAYVASKRRDRAAFDETVTDWERERYVPTL